ncbi:MAG: PAS domain-containing protein [Bryobacteraceae bacterium]
MRLYHGLSGSVWFLTRILPYRSTEDRIDGVVITFIDIDSAKRLRHCGSVRRTS